MNCCLRNYFTLLTLLLSVRITSGRIRHCETQVVNVKYILTMFYQNGGWKSKMFKQRAVMSSYSILAINAYIIGAYLHYGERGTAKLSKEPCKYIS